MKRSTLTLAANLWRHALIAHTDAGENEEECKVVARANELAQAALARLGVDRSEVASMQECIALAKEINE